MSSSEDCLNEWIAEACQGDESAAEALYGFFSPRVFRMAAALLNDAGDAEEVMQDAFVYALKNLRRYDPSRSAFQTWLFTIAISRCRNKRRRKWLVTVPLSWLDRNEKRNAVLPLEDWLAARGVRRELWSAVQSLSPKPREAIVLRFIGEMTYDEISGAVGCSAKAAESRVRTGIDALRRRLAEEGVMGREWLELLAAD